MKQKYDFSCGAASLATVLTYFYNDRTTEEEIIRFVLGKKRLYYKKIKDLKKEDFYLTLKDLVDYLKHNGYKPLPVALKLEDLKYLKYPAIVFVMFRGQEHFSVFKGIDDRYVYLADPSLGNIVVPIDRFKEMFYTRNDKNYPGKILIVYKNTKDVNPKFLSTEHLELDKTFKKMDIIDIFTSKIPLERF